MDASDAGIVRKERNVWTFDLRGESTQRSVLAKHCVATRGERLLDCGARGRVRRDNHALGRVWRRTEGGVDGVVNLPAVPLGENRRRNEERESRCS